MRPCIIVFFILSNKSYAFVDFYFKLIWINKFIKHNQVNYHIMVLNILIYIYLLIFLIFFFKKKIYEPKIGLLGCLLSLSLPPELDLFFCLFFLSYSKNISFIENG